MHADAAELRIDIAGYCSLGMPQCYPKASGCGLSMSLEERAVWLEREVLKRTVKLSHQKILCLT